MDDETETEAVREFLRRADRVYGEYDRGYVNADVALSTLRDHLDDLRATVEEDGDGDA